MRIVAGQSNCQVACDNGATFAGVQLQQLCTNVAYGPDKCNRLDAYLVASPTPSPVLVEIHGGGFHGGAKSSEFYVYAQTAGTNGVIEKALRHGISVVSLNYRLTSVTDACCNKVISGEGEHPDLANAFPAANDDVARAIQFVRSQGRSGAWNIDPNRVVAIGGSAGGTLAQWAAMHEDGKDPNAPLGTSNAESTRLDGVVSFGGPTDFGPDYFYACSFRPEIGWYFGTTQESVFNSDPSILSKRLAASPAWLADQFGAPSGGHAANRDIPVLGIHSGDPSWNLSSFFPPPVIPYCVSPDANPLWKPTLDAHSSLFGLAMNSPSKNWAGVRVAAKRGSIVELRRHIFS